MTNLKQRIAKHNFVLKMCNIAIVIIAVGLFTGLICAIRSI